MVEEDRDRINQAVSNLLNNAIKFTSKKREPYLSLQKKEMEAGMTIRKKLLSMLQILERG
jgi:signal transduction histidine kinase